MRQLGNLHPSLARRAKGRCGALDSLRRTIIPQSVRPVMHPFCKCGTLVALALWAAPVSAQFVPNAPARPGTPTITSIPTAGFVPPAPFANPGYYPGYSYFDPYGGYFRGVGDLV